MITRLLALPVVAVLAAVALTGCVRIAPPATESREIGDVTAVVLDTHGDLDITEGEPSLTIHAPADILSLLTSEVTDGVLELGRRPGVVLAYPARISYELTVPNLAALEVSGSGDVTADVSGSSLTVVISGSGDVTVTGIDADDVEVTIDGSGDVELSGAARNLLIDIGGSGEVDTEALDALDATVDISGSGSAKVTATTTLTVDISGSGSVEHTGGADVDAEISGSGSVDADD